MPKTTPGAAVRPNILFLVTDDQGFGDLGAQGHPTLKTPRLDAMAAGGMRLTECYCPSPVCSPARAGFLTGRTPLRTGIDNYLPPESPLSLPASEITIAELLREQGYATGHFGKWHLSSDLAGDGPTTPADHGFDAWFATESNAEPEHNDPINFVRNGEPAGPMAGHSSAIIVEETLRWLDTLPADQPWFACLWFHSPHAPVSASPAYREMYPEATENQQHYFGTLTETDAAIGKLDDAIAAKDPASGLLTVFTSDNGPAKLGDPPRHRHFGSSGGSAGGEGHPVRRWHPRARDRAVAGRGGAGPR